LCGISGAENSVTEVSRFVVLDPEDEGTTIIEYMKYCLPNNMT